MATTHLSRPPGDPHVKAERTRVVREREFVIRDLGELQMILRHEGFTGHLVIEFSQGSPGKATAEQRQVL